MFAKIDSSAWTPGDQLDALRSEVFEPLNLAQLVCSARVQNRLRWTSSIAQGASASFGIFTIDGFHTRRPRRTSPLVDDAFILVWVRQGSMVQELPNDSQNAVPTGSLYLYDTAQPCGFQWHGVHATYLVLPRTSVVSALEGKLPASGLLPTPATSLAPFLQSQLDLLESRGSLLAPASLGSAIDAAAHLALATLRESNQLTAHGDDDSETAGTPYRGRLSGANLALLAAARQHMHQQLHDHGLDANGIAAAVHGSRARLYRCFAAENSSVHGELRDLRLRAACHRLMHSADSVALIAWHCGFTSASSFSRTFRARMGASPQEWRARHL